MFKNFDIWMCISKMLDALLLAYVPARVLYVRKPAWNKWLVFSWSLLIIFIVLYGIEMVFYPVDFLYTLILQFAIAMLYACCFFRGKFYLKLILQSTSMCCTMLIHFVVVRSLTIHFGSFMQSSWEHIFSQAVLFPLLAYYFIRFCYIPKIDFPSRYGASMAALMLILSFITEAIRILMSGMDSPWYGVGINVTVLVIVLFLYSLFFSMIREYEGKKLMMQQMDMHKKHLEESTETYDDMLRLRHELKNHVFYMNSLLEQRQYANLAHYFKQVYQQEYTIDLIESGNNTMNAILNQKAVYAKAKGIPLTISAAVPQTLDIEASHVCAVISNLLDNAIEACEQLSAPDISITVRQKGRYLHIACKNTVAFDVIKENGALMTTKKSSQHGIGLQVVRNIVNAYDGMIDFHMENLVFVVTVMLKTGGNAFERVRYE